MFMFGYLKMLEKVLKKNQEKGFPSLQMTRKREGRGEEKRGREREREIRRKYYEIFLKYLLSYFPHKFWKSTLVYDLIFFF